MNPKNARIFSWKDARIVSGNTPYGSGAFASSSIKKGSLIMVFGGYVFTLQEEASLPEKIRDAAIQIDRNFVIGVLAEEDFSETDCINHSCEPNAGIKGQVSLVAMRDIEAGEEVTFDYGTVLLRKEGEPEYRVKCLCGSSNCRGAITHLDWQSPAFQKKYQDFLPYYILEEIFASKKMEGGEA